MEKLGKLSRVDIAADGVGGDGGGVIVEAGQLRLTVTNIMLHQNTRSI